MQEGFGTNHDRAAFFSHQTLNLNLLTWKLDFTTERQVVNARPATCKLPVDFQAFKISILACLECEERDISLIWSIDISECWLMVWEKHMD